MVTINLDLNDGMRRELETRLQDGLHASIEDYVRELVRADLERQDSWEMTPEIAAALAEGEASGYEPHDMQSIIAEARAKFLAE